MLQASIVCLLSAAGIWAGLTWFHSVWAALLLYHLILAGGFLWRNPRHLDARMALRGWRVPPVVLLIFFSATFGAGLFLGIRHLDPQGIHVLKKLRQAGLDGSAYWAFAIYTCAVNPFLEELYWRANYREAHGWIFDIFYALLHIPLFAILGGVPAAHWPLPIAGLTMAGLLWRFTARGCKGLGPALAGHAALDMALFVAIALAAH